MFDEHFEVVFADTESARRIHYRMRYQVYCLDRGYEDPELYPQGEESDEWDNRAAHFMVRHRPTGQWLATLRVVLPRKGHLPLTRHCRLRGNVSASAPLERAAEISRLCIWPAGRRLAAALPALGSQWLMALLRAARDYSRAAGLRHWYFLITPGLARMVGRLCLSLAPAGEPCELRGVRIPYVADVERGLEQAPFDMQQRFENLPPYRRYSELEQEVLHRRRRAVAFNYLPATA